MSALSATDYIRYIAEKYNLYVGIFNLIIGLISNILIILIFTNMKIFRKNQSSFYFIIESLSNILLITTMYVSRISTVILGYDPISISIVWCKMRAMIVQGCGLHSLLTICCITIDQYLATNHRYILRKMSTLKLAYRLGIFNVCFTVLHSSIFLVFNDIQLSAGCAVYNSILKKYLSFFYYPIFGNSLPILITITFSLLAYRNVRRIIRRQIPIVRRRLDRQLTSMVLSRVISIVICGFPYVCLTLYGLNIDRSKLKSIELAVLALLTAIFDTLLFTNFSINFYLFLAISSRFRHQVKQFFVKQVWRSLKSCCFEITIHSNSNQIAPENGQRVISIIESV